MNKETKQETWLIEPRDALIVRDGRPFGMNAGNRADSLDFPFPSTTTGAARTRAGLNLINGDLSKFPKHEINGESLADAVQKIAVCGALLAEIKNGNVEFLVHAPADCAVFEVEENGKRKDEKFGKLTPLVPLEEESESKYLSNLNDKHKHNENLFLLGLQKQEKSKPHKNAPRFWYWCEFEKWLNADNWLRDYEGEKKYQNFELKNLGINGLPKDRRTHVEMDYASKSGKDGGLFETRGLEFTQKQDGFKKYGLVLQVRNQTRIDCHACKDGFKKYGLVLQVDYGNFSGKIEEGIAPLGGERRLVAWRKSSETFPDCPAEIKTKISAEKHCRLVLLTPVIFEEGFLPTWLKTPNGLKVEVAAVAVNRHQVISGYDFVKKSPKPTRRMCPAGTVFFVKLEGDDSAIENWINKTWFSCMSDIEQDRKDGFGLAALGTWDGKLLKIEEALKNEKD